MNLTNILEAVRFRFMLQESRHSSIRIAAYCSNTTHIRHGFGQLENVVYELTIVDDTNYERI